MHATDLYTYSSILLLIDIEKPNKVKTPWAGWANSMERGDKGLLKWMK